MTHLRGSRAAYYHLSNDVRRRYCRPVAGRGVRYLHPRPARRRIDWKALTVMVLVFFILPGIAGFVENMP